uniref:snaclec subunit B-like n=1 Tax=Centroberyx gerrardi TaxID=166262 RepID=UPI003AABAA45
MDVFAKYICNDTRRSVHCTGTNNTDKFHLIREEKTWRQAQDYCREKHTDLISGNQTFNEEVKNMIKKRMKEDFVIGLFRDSWKWSDGSNSSFRYWHPNVIENPQGSCTVTRLDPQGRWKDEECDEKKPFFCYD